MQKEKVTIALGVDDFWYALDKKHYACMSDWALGRFSGKIYEPATSFFYFAKEPLDKITATNNPRLSL